MDRQDYRYFRRLAALLLALAELAERAGGACLPVRCLVLWILRRAEAVALAYAIEAAGSPFAGCQRADVMRDDASRLATNLRALSAVFGALADQAWLAQKSSPALSGVTPLRRSILACLRTLTALRSRRLDTS